MKPIERLKNALEEFKGKKFETFEGQCEAAKYIQDKHKLGRADIALILELSERQVKTRLSSGLLNCVAKGLIPSVEFESKTGFSSKAAIEVLKDEDAKSENLKLGSEARNVLKMSHFSDKLLAAIGSQLPSEEMLERLKLYAASFKTFRVNNENRPTKIAMATMSDAHFFQVSGTFNPEVAQKANFMYFHQVFERTRLARMHSNIDTIHLNLLGDNMQGTANYDNQRWDADRPSIDQAEWLTKIYVGNVIACLQHFDHVVINGMPGNHGKITKNSTDPDYSNWETVVLRSLQWAFRTHNRVTFNLTDDWYQIIEANGQKFMLTHGHAMHGAGNYDNVVSTIRKWQDTLEYFDYVVLGHFHRLAMLPLTRNKSNPKHRFVFMNGCYPTEDSFIEKFGASHTNLQWLFFIGEAGITDAIDIELYGDHNGATKVYTS